MINNIDNSLNNSVEVVGIIVLPLLLQIKSSSRPTNMSFEAGKKERERERDRGIERE